MAIARLYYMCPDIPISDITVIFDCSRHTVIDMIHCALSSSGPNAREILALAQRSIRRIKPSDPDAEL